MRAARPGDLVEPVEQEEEDTIPEVRLEVLGVEVVRSVLAHEVSAQEVDGLLVRVLPIGQRNEQGDRPALLDRISGS